MDGAEGLLVVKEGELGPGKVMLCADGAPGLLILRTDQTGGDEGSVGLA